MNLAVLRDRIKEYNECSDPEQSHVLYDGIVKDILKMSASGHPNAVLLANEFLSKTEKKERWYS